MIICSLHSVLCTLVPRSSSQDVLYLFQFFLGERRCIKDAQVIHDLLGAAGADEGGGDDLVAQHPLEGQVVQLLAPGLGDVLEGADLIQILVRQRGGL